MKNAVRKMMMIALIGILASGAMAQGKVDEARMRRDLEVTENILSTLIKQKFDRRSFFPMEIRGEYREGLGVTYRLPYSMGNSIVWGVGGSQGGIDVVEGFGYSTSPNVVTLQRGQQANERNLNGTARVSGINKVNSDSIYEITSQRMIDAAKEFIADYGDLIGQLSPSEKIIITNRGESNRVWYGAFMNASRPSYLSVEATRGDLTALKQGKIKRDEFLKKIIVINSVMDDELQPDLELLTSIFNRLYRSDLSKTFFSQNNIYYERLKDYGAIYFMQVYSSNGTTEGYGMGGSDMKLSMPTLGLSNLTQEERDKKVTELYPQFEKDIKADILEYGRTLKSLKDSEVLIFNITLTKCHACGIPSSLEISVKNDVLQDYGSGKLSKEAALAKITVTKGPTQ